VSGRQLPFGHASPSANDHVRVQHRVLLFLIGTASFPGVLVRDFRSNPQQHENVNKLDQAAMKVNTQYAYDLTVVLWLFWICLGSVLESRRRWMRHKPALPEDGH
jgi:hypothetical protein